MRRHQRGYAFAAVLAIVVVALLAWFGTTRGQEPASINAGNISTSTVSTSPTTTGQGSTSSTEGTGAGGSSSTDGSTSTSQSAETTVSSSAEPTLATDSETTSDGLKLVLEVTQGSCWLVVREDSKNGAEIYAGTLAAGGRQTFDSAKRYWMNVGRPSALTASVGGKSYTLAEPAGAFVVTEAGIERSE